MNFLLFLFLLSLLLIHSFAQESDHVDAFSWPMPTEKRNLRAIRDDVQTHMEQRLEENLSNLRSVTTEFDQDIRKLTLDLSSLEKIFDDICVNIEHAFKEKVTCKCRFIWYQLKLTFKCPSIERVTLNGFNGIAEYYGNYDITIINLDTALTAGVCITNGEYQGHLMEKLCVEGKLCLGRSKQGFCGCKARYGPLICPCTKCPTGTGVSTKCGPFALQPVCIPIPYVRSMRPAAKTIDALPSATTRVQPNENIFNETHRQLNE